MKQFAAILFASNLTASLLASNIESIDLSGKWRFAIDGDSTGQQQKWYQTALPGKDIIMLPGSIQQQEYGSVPGPDTSWVGTIRQEEWDKPKYSQYRSPENFKIPFWLQPDHYYKGRVWYQKTVLIPDAWKQRRISLFLERPHWETTIWIDSKWVGSANHLSTPHIFDLSNFLEPGEHCLTICVDNREIIDVGINSHSISDHTQSNWNGIVGRIELHAEPAAWIDDIQIYPDTNTAIIKTQVHFGNLTGKSLSGKFRLEVSFKEQMIAFSESELLLDSDSRQIEVTIPLGETIRTWDEFSPNLYILKTRFTSNWGVDVKTTPFAFRQVATKGTRFTLNGRPIFLRGTLECCIFPKTGYPPMDIDTWKRIINTCKAHGLNHIRFHSWCPPEAAFTAADELGFYFQVECSSWANNDRGQGIGNEKSVDRWLYDEADAILKAYGNHPSFLLLAYGNEPGGPESGAVYLREWVSHFKKKDPRHLVTSASGWPLIEQSDYHVWPAPRIQQWGQQLRSRINSSPPETTTDYRNYVTLYPNQPVISHEIGQWCVYPDFDEIRKYTGVLKPKNFEVFRDFLEQKNLLDQAHDFFMASGKLQALCYKEEIESALRTPGFGGFQLLDLHDFPGQGTALVGVLDPFWDSKPYITPGQYRKFCNAIVPLLRLQKRIFTASDTFSAQVEVSHFGPVDLLDAEIEWSFLDDQDQCLREGILPENSICAGDLHSIGSIHFPLSDMAAPAKYKLLLKIKDTDVCNDWDVWIYPDTVDLEAPDSIMISGSLDQSTSSFLEKGGNVLLAVNPTTVKTDVKLGFSSIFWNTAWTNGQAPHTLGILCNPSHPALADFPTEYHSNWQWSEVIQHAAAMEMDHLPSKLRPIVQIVPDWFEPKRLGLIFEAKTGKGKLVICSINILNELEKKPVLRQLRHSLLHYMQSDDFNPEIQIDIESIKSLFYQQ